MRAYLEDRAEGLLPRLSPRLLSLLGRSPSSVRRRIIRSYLRVHPLPRAPRAELVDEVARCWSDVPLPRPLDELVEESRRLLLIQAAERLAAFRDGPASAGRHLEIQSLEPLEAALQSAGGAVVLSPSFLAWHRVAPALARRGYLTGLLDLRPPHRFAQRSESTGPGVHVESLRCQFLARSLVRFAKTPGRVVVAVGDEGFGPRWANGTLLGRGASVGSTPFELARRLGLPLLPVFPVHDGPVPRLLVESGLRVSDTGRGDVDLDTTAARWLKLVSRYARRYPEQYLPFLQLRRVHRGTDPMPLFADANDLD